MRNPTVLVDEEYAIHTVVVVSAPFVTGVGDAYTESPAAAPVAVVEVLTHVDVAMVPKFIELVAEIWEVIAVPAAVLETVNEPAFTVVVPTVNAPVILAFPETVKGFVGLTVPIPTCGVAAFVIYKPIPVLVATSNKPVFVVVAILKVPVAKLKKLVEEVKSSVEAPATVPALLYCI